MTRPLLERAAGHRVPNIIPIAKAGSRRLFSDRIWQHAPTRTRTGSPVMRGRLLAALSALLFSQGLAFAQQLGSDPDQWAGAWDRRSPPLVELPTETIRSPDSDIPCGQRPKMSLRDFPNLFDAPLVDFSSPPKNSVSIQAFTISSASAEPMILPPMQSTLVSECERASPAQNGSWHTAA